MWSVRDDPHFTRIGRFLSSPVARFLYLRLNFSPKVIWKRAMRGAGSYTKSVHRHYVQPFATASDRQGTWVLARELLGSSEWYESLWQQRMKIGEKPALIIWGLKDFAFPTSVLDRWLDLFTNRQVLPLADISHAPPEEVGPTLVAEIDRFIVAHP